MREHIINALHRRMATDQRLFFVNADVGINLVERIAESYPDRYLNVGIAEQNMIGVCAGLANCGYRPVTYTISNFASSRCLEQIRDEVGLHDYPIIMLGTTTGFDNSTLGPTHHAVDDWGAVRTVPNIEIHCPSSVPYAAPLFDDLVERSVAAYIRIPKGSFPKPASPDPVVHLPGAQSDVLVVTYGGLANAYIQAQQQEPRLALMVFNRLRPIDEDAVANVWSRYSRIIVVEDHFADVGLFATACQIAVKQGLSVRLESRAPTRYYREVGDGPEHFWKKFGADPKSLLAEVFGDALVAVP